MKRILESVAGVFLAATICCTDSPPIVSGDELRRAGPPPLVSGDELRRAGDWPMYGGHPDRNMVSSEKGLPLTWDAATKANIKWIADLGTETFGNPIVAGGRIFIGTNNGKPRDAVVKGPRCVLMCFSEADGKFLWQAVHEKLPKETNEDEGDFGLYSTPCAVGDRIYYVSNRAELVCRAAQDGKPVWVLDMRKDLGVSAHRASASSPLVVGDLVFVVTGQGRDFATRKVKNPKAPSFIAVDRASGKVAWQDSSPGDRILTGQWGSPAYGVVEGQPQVAFPGGDGWLYSFEPATGKLLWKFNCKAHEKVADDGKGEPTATTLVATPVFAGHRVLLVIGVPPGDGNDSDPGCFRAIDARKRGDVTGTAEVWRVEGKVLDAKEGVSASISTMTAHEDLVYATDLQGFLYCFELATGKCVWRHDLLASAWGSPVVADGKIYVRTADGTVFVFKPGREDKLLAKSDKLPDIDNGTVVAANGVLYIAGKNKLYAIEAKK